MFLFILGTIFLVAFVVITSRNVMYKRKLRAWQSKPKDERSSYDEPDEPPFIIGIIRWVALGIGALMLVFSFCYMQDPGESIVLRNFTGIISGVTSDAGLHTKSPFDSAIKYDVRNNTVTFYGSEEQSPYKVHGGTVEGPQITFQDKEGVTGNLDIVVRYSLDPTQVAELYKEYQSQENFCTKTVQQDVRSVTRQIPSQYGTLNFYNSRAEAEQKIYEALEARWANQPIILEAVNLQEIRYDSEVTAKFNEAQRARTAVEAAKADLEKANVEAEIARTVAQGQADANDILTQSLTDEVLRQRYIDALSKSSTIYVVPEGSTPLVGVAP